MRDVRTMPTHSHAMSERELHYLHDDVQRYEQWTTRWQTQSDQPRWWSLVLTLTFLAALGLLALWWFEML